MDNKITKVEDFEKELKEIDPRLSIIRNPNRPQIANIKLDGQDICAIPADEIKELPDPSYTITFPNGFIAKHKCKQEAIAIVKSTLELISKPEGADIFFDR